MYPRVVFSLLLLASAFSEDIRQKSDRSDFKRSLGKNCDNSYTATCLKLDIVGWVEGLNEKGNINVLPGVSIVRENSSAKANTADLVAELGREFPNDPDARLDGFLMKKVQGFLDSHSLKLNFAEAGDGTFEGRKKNKGGGGGMGMMMAAAAMMKGTLATVAMGALAALAGKALMTSLISLLISTIIGLKSLTSGGGKSVEVISTKGHEDHGGHGWSRRSLDVPLPLGLRPEYKPT
ncbi:unnamed protein product [Psylliodes chrysocephalus]|uniref:Osiris 16 n=1 Tax=Psylliodes chrysocephalus TaxID=3402493 RepID=A0A9P0CXH7_9CUCU|nr:unnamed protein product [Psylliodes chrysocephala]